MSYDRHTRPYAIVPSELLRDPGLSLRAKGLQALLIDLPAGWLPKADDLAARSLEGRDAVRAARRELVARGWLVEERSQHDDGTWRTVTHIMDRPGCTLDMVRRARHSYARQQQLDLDPQAVDEPETESQAPVRGMPRDGTAAQRGDTTTGDGISVSGLTSANTAFPQVAPETGKPESGGPVAIGSKEQSNPARARVSDPDAAAEPDGPAAAAPADPAVAQAWRAHIRKEHRWLPDPGHSRTPSGKPHGGDSTGSDCPSASAEPLEHNPPTATPTPPTATAAAI